MATLLQEQRTHVGVAKIVEVSAESTESFEDAVRRGIAKASETVHGIRSAWVKSQQVSVADGRVVAYRVDLKITFVLD